MSVTVRDMPMHRHLLMDLVMDFCVGQDYCRDEHNGYEVVWNILADELSEPLNKASLGDIPMAVPKIF